MVSVLWVLFILDSLLLIGIILIQPGEGGDLAAAFGGASSQTTFGARGSTTFLQKATTWLAVTFMVLAIVLVIVTNMKHKSIVEKNIFSDNPVTSTDTRKDEGANSKAATDKKADQPAEKADSKTPSDTKATQPAAKTEGDKVKGEEKPVETK